MKNKIVIGLSCMKYIEEHDEPNEELYLKVIKPFLRELYKYPEINAVLHFPGVLLDWLEDKHPELIMLISELIKKKKQLELLGSGYYEPILTMISPTDRTGQIESLTTLIRKKFGKRPRGCWIAGNYWDNSLVNPIKNSGMDYIFLDFEKMMIAGITEEDMFSSCVTEENGKLLNVFPIHREIIKKHKTNEAGEFVSFLNIKEKKEKLFSVIFREYDFENKDEQWIADFFRGISEADNLETISPFNYIKNNGRFKKAYFQNNNFFKKILAESPETNLLYSKMIHIQTLINQIRGDKYKKKAAQESLWAGQNFNLFNIINNSDSKEARCDMMQFRKKAYKYLIDAELEARQQGVFIPSLIKTDFDLDGVEEYMYQGEEYNFYLHVDGGTVFEFDRFKNLWNYADAVRCENGKSEICRSFQDRIYKTSLEDDQLENDELKKDSLFLGKEEYLVENYDRENKIIKFIKRIKQDDINIKLSKQYRFLKKRAEVIYEISNIGSRIVNRTFSTEINFSFSNDSEGKDYYKADSYDIQMKDEKYRFHINSTVPFRNSIREINENNVNNFSRFEMFWNLDELTPGKTVTFKIEIKI